MYIILYNGNQFYFITADSSQLRFSYKPQNRSVLVNEKGVYLLCVATGNVSSYKWLKDGVSIQDSGIEYQLAAGGSILNFTNITDRIQGVYSCVVESEASQIIQSKAWIHILSKSLLKDLKMHALAYIYRDHGLCLYILIFNTLRGRIKEKFCATLVI